MKLWFVDSCFAIYFLLLQPEICADRLSKPQHPCLGAPSPNPELQNLNVNLPIKNPPPRSCFAFLVRGGGGSNSEPGGWGRTGYCSSRNTSSTSRRKSRKIGDISGPADNIIIATPLLLPMDVVDIFSGSELVRKQTPSSGIFLAQQESTNATPCVKGWLTISFAPRTLHPEV